MQAGACAGGLKRCVLPLRGEADGSAEYTVWLYFPPSDDSEAHKTTFDIKLQGNVVAKAFDPAKTTADAPVEFTGIGVEHNLEVELAYADGTTPPAEQAPVLSGIEVLCTDKPKKADAKQVALR